MAPNKNINPVREKNSSLGELPIPDCLRCMRKKLRATSIVVFFQNPDKSWRLADFQGDKPMDVVEAEFQYMLKTKMPEIVLQHGKTFFLNGKEAISRIFPKLGNLFEDQSIIAAPVKYETSFGVRIAWRDEQDVFSDEDLKTLECVGKCPEGCGPAPDRA